MQDRHLNFPFLGPEAPDWYCQSPQTQRCGFDVCSVGAITLDLLQKLERIRSYLSSCRYVAWSPPAVRTREISQADSSVQQPA